MYNRDINQTLSLLNDAHIRKLFQCCNFTKKNNINLANLQKKNEIVFWKIKLNSQSVTNYSLS